MSRWINFCPPFLVWARGKRLFNFEVIAFPPTHKSVENYKWITLEIRRKYCYLIYCLILFLESYSKACRSISVNKKVFYIGIIHNILCHMASETMRDLWRRVCGRDFTISCLYTISCLVLFSWESFQPTIIETVGIM